LEGLFPDVKRPAAAGLFSSNYYCLVVFEVSVCVRVAVPSGVSTRSVVVLRERSVVASGFAG
jgi:hypothetical protein